MVTAPVASASAAPVPTVTATVSATAAPASDPIDRLVARLSASPMWNNGGFAKIDLPKAAKTADVLAKVFASISFDQGPVTRHKIVEERKVHIANDDHDYTAIVVDTNFGQRVALISYWGPTVGWWSRVFDDE